MNDDFPWFEFSLSQVFDIWELYFIIMSCFVLSLAATCKFLERILLNFGPVRARSTETVHNEVTDSSF